MGPIPVGKLWMIRAAFFICLAVVNRPVNCQIREYVVTPNFPDDSEPKRTVTMPNDPIAYFKSFTRGAEYVGLLQAGRAEFPWVVDIQNSAVTTDTTDEAWAVGNLINFQYVLTTCKAIYHLSGDKTITEVPTPQLRILFCTNYLKENYKRYREDEHELFWIKLGRIDGAGGVRKSKGVITHEKCQVKRDQAWDIALIRLDVGVPPSYYPVIAYMPAFSIQGHPSIPYSSYDYTKPIQPADNTIWSYQEAQKMVCYIASFGKSFVSNMKNYVIDYKVKYRVYWTKMQDCEGFLKWICEDSTKDPACSRGISSTAKNQLLCFISRAVQGAVCDHDRGAPLVCNGEVYGRSYANIKDHYAKGYKVKYRVYRAPIEECLKYFTYTCEEVFVDGYTAEAKDQMMCFESRSLQGAEYDPEQPVEMNPIETPIDWFNGANWRSYYKSGTEPPKYFGSTLAGQAEFTWVVDIRNPIDPVIGNWATGNLISDYWVLTACSIVKDWEKLTSYEEIIKRFAPYIVSFCTNYIWEDYTRFNENNQALYHLFQGHDDAGARTIKKVMKHPQCNTMTRTFNFLLLKVNNHIPIYIPVIGYMPLFGAPASITDSVINEKAAVFSALQGMDGKGREGYKKLVCYVAAFGRPYSNVRKPMNENYKVKYRAYFSDYDYCSGSTYKLYQALCSNNGNNPRSNSDKTVVNDECSDSLSFNGGKLGPFLCFRTYAKHGAVCDHDHGAPLVCNGEVYGFVVRGVPPEYCVNNRMFPFIVAKIDALQGSHIFRQPPGIPNFGR